MIKKCVLDSVQKRIAGGQEDAFIVVDLKDVGEKVESWRRLLPRVEPFYAVKCNEDERILEKFVNLGMSFDCASKKEISKVLSLGATSEQVVFANPCKVPSHVAYAKEMGVELLTFDNHDELIKIKKIYPEAKLLLRLLPDDSSAVCQLGIKYGAELETVPSLFQAAKDLSLNVVGVSYHVGSGCKSVSAFSEAVTLARKAFDIAKALGIELTMLDIGGGFPGDAVSSWPSTRENDNDNDNSNNYIINNNEQDEEAIKKEHYDSNNDSIMFPNIATLLCEALDRYFPQESGVRIIGEPGRYMVHSACTLAVNIIGRRRTVVRDDLNNDNFNDEASQHHGRKEVIRYYINDGVYGSFNNTIYDHAHVFGFPVPKNNQNIQEEDDPTMISSMPSIEVVESTVWGPTCDGLDCVAKNLSLPLLEVGDWLYFPGMGAYTMAAASTFNGMDLAQRYYLEED